MEQDTEQLEEMLQSEGTMQSEETLKPEGEALFEMDVHMSTGVLYDYLLRHIYTSFSGIFGTIIGILLAAGYFMKGLGIIYLICGIIVIFYLPWSLFLTAKKQMLLKVFQSPIHYTFYENGVEVSQDGVSQMQRWENMVKAVSTSKSIILYTGKKVASIFPRKDLEGDATGLIRIICSHMDPKKVKIKY